MSTSRECTKAALPAACAVLLLSSLAWSQHGLPGEAKAAEDAATLFASSCSTCHLPPDPDHETDRAWLDQIRDTA